MTTTAMQQEATESWISEQTNSETLIAALQDLLSLTVGNVQKMALIVKRIDEIEPDADLPIDNRLAQTLRRIAHGQLMPELFVRLQGSPSVLNHCARLPMPEQKHIAEVGSVPVFEPSGEGHRMVPIDAMSGRETRQVFDRGRLRTEAEQMSWLRDQEHIARTKKVDETPVEIDRRRNGIIANGLFVPVKTIHRLLAELADK